MEADEPGIQRAGEHLGDLGLANACFAFEEDGFVEAPGEEDRGSDIGAGKVLLGRQALGNLFDRFEHQAQGRAERGEREADSRIYSSLRHAALWPAGTGSVRLQLNISAESTRVPGDYVIVQWSSTSRPRSDGMLSAPGLAAATVSSNS